MFTLSVALGLGYPVVSAGTAGDIIEFIKTWSLESYEYTIINWLNGVSVSEYLSDSKEDIVSYLNQYV
jgi:hypothetical protein